MRVFSAVSMLAAITGSFAMPAKTNGAAKTDFTFSQVSGKSNNFMISNQVNQFTATASAGANLTAAPGQPVNTNTLPYSVLFPPGAPLSSSDAFSNFANHVYGVSGAIMGLSTAQGSAQIQALGNIGLTHELLEAIEAQKMGQNTNNQGGAPLTSLIQNTPCVLNGFKSAINNPTPANALLVAQQISTVRDSTILPNILALGALSGASNLLQFPGTGPMLGQGQVQVQPAGSQALLQAQTALGCAVAGGAAPAQ
ncbi:hypothetical protein BDR26DRAFT_848813 [Obelidium mucronatum]|nr:hypothetical protein BDR26DRAFT_848813 [Obelidium mucronatum]